MLLAVNAISAGEKRLKVYAIAYIYSAYCELEDLAIRNDWLVTGPEEAETIVAAIRSRQVNPLKNEYSDCLKLEEDVKKYTDAEGTLHLIYFYKVRENRGLILEKQIFSKVEE